MRYTPWLLVPIVCSSLAGCADVQRSDQDTPLPAAPSPWSAHGLRYTPIRQNHPEQYSLARAEALVSTRASARSDVEMRSQMTLAERMTGLALVGDWIYRVEPDPETVKAAREHMGAEIRGNAPRKNDEASLVAALAQPLIIDDGRDRQRQLDTTQYPFSAIVQLNERGLPQGEFNGATGVMIGPATLLSAAHVFYDGANFRTFDMQPGGDEQNPAPFGSFGCYGVVIASSTTWPIDDYAVVDFQFKSPTFECNDSPGAASGWMAVHLHSDAELQNFELQLYGYPFEINPWPQLWGMSGHAVTVGNAVLDWDMDQTEGQSGAPVYWIDGNGFPDVVAITSRGDSDFGQIENGGPRMTQSTIDNIRAWSTDY